MLLHHQKIVPEGCTCCKLVNWGMFVSHFGKSHWVQVSINAPKVDREIYLRRSRKPGSTKFMKCSRFLNIIPGAFWGWKSYLAWLKSHTISYPDYDIMLQDVFIYSFCLFVTPFFHTFLKVANFYLITVGNLVP